MNSDATNSDFRLRVLEAKVAVADAKRNLAEAKLGEHLAGGSTPPAGAAVVPPPAPASFTQADPAWKSGTQLTKEGRIALCVAILMDLDHHRIAILFGIGVGSVRSYVDRVRAGGKAAWPRGENLWPEVVAAARKAGVPGLRE